MEISDEIAKISNLKDKREAEAAIFREEVSLISQGIQNLQEQCDIIQERIDNLAKLPEEEESVQQETKSLKKEWPVVHQRIQIERTLLRIKQEQAELASQQARQYQALLEGASGASGAKNVGASTAANNGTGLRPRQRTWEYR